MPAAQKTTTRIKPGKKLSASVARANAALKKLGRAATPALMPLIIPAPPGTYILHVVKHDGQDSLDLLMHVCTHFERFPDRVVPISLVPAKKGVIEAAVLHPTGHVSGSPAMALTFENVDSYRTNLIERIFPKTRVSEAAAKQLLPVLEPTPKKAAVKRTGTKAEARAALRRLEAADPEEDLIG